VERRRQPRRSYLRTCENVAQPPSAVLCREEEPVFLPVIQPRAAVPHCREGFFTSAVDRMC